MLILSIRTDKPEAEVGLFNDTSQLAYEVWEAHRALAETIHTKIKDMLSGQGKTLHDIEAIIAYAGPGSFTGLRIGLSVANALAYSVQIPIVGVEGEEAWLEKGLQEIASGHNDRIVLPEYGAPVHITTPKK